MDIVQIRGLKVETIIGVQAWEKKLPRTILIDIELATDATAAARSDAIADTVDYQAVADAATGFVSSSRVQLVETLADRLAAHLQETVGAPWVRLTVHKPGAVPKTQDVSVTVERGSRGR